MRAAIKKGGIIAVIFILLVTFFSDIFSLDWKESICEVYEKGKDVGSWGNIYSWLFNEDYFRKSYALVIGVANYRQNWSTLEASYHDAIRVRDFLIEDAGFDYVLTITNTEATWEKIRELMVDTFPDKLGPKDRFLFYFSGHGTRRKISNNNYIGYLVLHNCDSKSYSNMISMRNIEEWDYLMSTSQHVLFVLDCCFSGLAGHQSKSPPTNQTITGLSKYAHHLITAGTANETSVASIGNWGGSLFTDSFIKGASGRADLRSADFGPDGVVSLHELMIYIRTRINKESERLKAKSLFSKGIAMTPQVSELQLDNDGEFFFITKDCKNIKINNAPQTYLNFGWPIKTKGGSAIEKTILRKEPQFFSSGYVESMLKYTDYFDHDNNKAAIGFENDFEVHTSNSDTLILDHNSGLMWQQGGSDNPMKIEDAKRNIKKLNRENYAGFRNWRLPTFEEAMSLIEKEQKNGDLYIDPMFDKRQRSIWTCDSVKQFERSVETLVIYFNEGLCSWYGKKINTENYVRAVRSIK